MFVTRRPVPASFVGSGYRFTTLTTLLKDLWQKTDQRGQTALVTHHEPTGWEAPPAPHRAGKPRPLTPRVCSRLAWTSPEPSGVRVPSVVLLRRGHGHGGSDPHRSSPVATHLMRTLLSLRSLPQRGRSRLSSSEPERSCRHHPLQGSRLPVHVRSTAGG